MKLYIIRHGQTEANNRGVLSGWEDNDSLSEEGHSQAREVIAKLPKTISKVYSSDLLRCKQTAEVLSKNLNIPIIFDTRLRERNFGSLVGKSWKEIDSTDQVRINDQKHLTYDYRPFGGESIQDVRNRVNNFIEELRERTKDDAVAIVTHAGIVRLFQLVLAGNFEEKIENAVIYALDID